MIPKFHYYTENVDGHWITFPIIVEKHRAYFCPVLITPWNNELYQRLEELQIKFLMRINMIPELKDKFILIFYIFLPYFLPLLHQLSLYLHFQLCK